LKIDDSLDVFPVHGVGGVIGTLLAGVFSATSLGVFSGWGFAEGIHSMGGQLYVQAIGVLATAGFTAVLTWGILKLVDAVTGLRVNADEEQEGLDLVLHEERGYDIH
jgi:Amt family ammonium transporter